MERWTILIAGLGVRCELTDCEELATHKVDTSEGTFIGCHQHAEEAAKNFYRIAQVKM